MRTLWIDISDIPAEGREFSFTDLAIWQGPASEFHMELDFDGEIGAELLIHPFERGCSVSGRLAGRVTSPCGRCLEPAVLELDQEFDLSQSLDDETDEGEALLREADGKIELDAGTILWEQFVLALPDKVLCSEECKGLCPQCGANLNTEPCSCANQGGDPRLAVLRGLKVPGPKKG